MPCPEPVKADARGPAASPARPGIGFQQHLQNFYYTASPLFLGAAVPKRRLFWIIVSSAHVPTSSQVGNVLSVHLTAPLTVLRASEVALRIFTVAIASESIANSIVLKRAIRSMGIELHLDASMVAPLTEVLGPMTLLHPLPLQ